MMVRLFGNMMSGVFVIGIVLSLAGLLVPIPFMALDLLTGVIQAYIFSVLAMVFIGAAVGDEPAGPRPSSDHLPERPGMTAQDWIHIVSIIAAAVSVAFGAMARRWARGARSPRRWMRSPASRRPPTPSRAPCSWAWR